jgi:hypothetical protein
MSVRVSRVIALSSLSAFGTQLASAAREARFAPSQPQAGAAPVKPQAPGAPTLPLTPAPNTPRGSLLDLTV